MHDKLLNTKQAAALLGLRPSCLENWRWRGSGPSFVRLSARAIRYRQPDLEAFVDERVRPSTSVAARIEGPATEGERDAA